MRTNLKMTGLAQTPTDPEAPPALDGKTIVGYARVSTDEQKLDLQILALKSVGCNRIYRDQGQSGRSYDRDGLKAALDSLKPGETLVVWRLDRLGRSLLGLVQLIDLLGKRSVNFRSIMENIDTVSSGGRLVFHMMAALAEFERSIISERTRAGMAAAKEHGRQIGRPRVLSEAQIRQAFCAVHCQGVQLSKAAGALGVSASTLQRSFREIRATAPSACRNCGRRRDEAVALATAAPRRS